MKTCLVVDDSAIVRKIIGRIVRDMGFEVVQAADGAQALEICKASIPTSVLLDWNMPNMTGIEFLKSVRAQPNGEKPVVMFCTMEKEPEQVKMAMDFGANGYIKKPIDNHIIRTEFERLGLI